MLTVAGAGELRWLDGRVGDATTDGSQLQMIAPRSSDWFNDPMGPTRHSSAPALVFEPDGDFQLSARASVEFENAFDAAVLFVHRTNDDFAKLCFEYSPDHHPMVVSVVTREVSDDANGPVVEGWTVWLRVSRIGATYAFHHSLDGHHWLMTRLFALRDGSPLASVGFVAQSPTGDSCTVRFDDVTYRRATLTDVRDGT